MKIGIVAEALDWFLWALQSHGNIHLHFVHIWVADTTKEAQNGFFFFSNEKEILQNLHFTKKEIALKLHASEWIIHTKSWCHFLSLFLYKFSYIIRVQCE